MLNLLLATNIIIALLCGVPQWVRIYRRKSSKDVSLMSVVMVEWLQLSNMGIAIWQGHITQAEWFGLNAVLVAVSVAMIVRYRPPTLDKILRSWDGQ